MFVTISRKNCWSQLRLGLLSRRLERLKIFAFFQFWIITSKNRHWQYKANNDSQHCSKLKYSLLHWCDIHLFCVHGQRFIVEDDVSLPYLPPRVFIALMLLCFHWVGVLPTLSSAVSLSVQTRPYRANIVLIVKIRLSPAISSAIRAQYKSDSVSVFSDTKWVTRKVRSWKYRRRRVKKSIVMRESMLSRLIWLMRRWTTPTSKRKKMTTLAVPRQWKFWTTSESVTSEIKNVPNKFES